jgi:hypothetical protein
MVQVPTPAASAAFAASNTAGSISGVSSLGHSIQSWIPRRQSTETWGEDAPDEQGDSDESDTDNEAEYQVDFSEHFWRSRDQGHERIHEGDDQFIESDTDIQGGNITHSPELDNNCPKFQFFEMTTDDAAGIKHPPKIYDLDTGLKIGIATAFKSPLGAFRQAGFTQRLVAYWTKNSNTYVGLIHIVGFDQFGTTALLRMSN